MGAREQKVDQVRETRESAARDHVKLVEKQVEDLSAGNNETTPEEMTEEFDDTDTADIEASQAEKADPDDEKNTP